MTADQELAPIPLCLQSFVSILNKAVHYALRTASWQLPEALIAQNQPDFPICLQLQVQGKQLPFTTIYFLIK